MKFWKMNGAGNDFIILNNLDGSIPNAAYSELAKILCARRLSIGGDGLMIVVPPVSGGDFGMLFYNSDGSLGEMCGNGARCICRFGYENGLAGSVQFVETTAGRVSGFRLSNSSYRVRLNDPSVVKLYETVEVDGKPYSCAYIELGDPGIPHVVLEMKGLANADESELKKLGRALRFHPMFPRGANVNFYDIIGENSFLLKTYERGVEDFTYACGTGTGSTALALFLTGECGTHLTAKMHGGMLSVDIDANHGKVTDLWLTGPTNIAAVGEVTDENIELLLGRF